MGESLILSFGFWEPVGSYRAVLVTRPIFPKKGFVIRPKLMDEDQRVHPGLRLRFFIMRLVINAHAVFSRKM
jgi:hypothetical protein